MNFYAILGEENIIEGNYIETLQKNSYLFGYGCDQGAYDNVYKTAYAEQFATLKINSIFAVFLGSYLADWDSQNNLLRSAIASQPSMLVAFFSGRPFWHFHHLSLGETIGFAELISSNNRLPGTERCLYNSTGKWGYREIHNTIIGDPTLRIHIVEPIKNLKAKLEGGNGSKKVVLNWTPPSDANVLGYNVYRARNYDSKFVLLNKQIIKDEQFIDINPLPDSCVYMIRALKLEQAPTGSYYNLSQGIFAEIYDSTAKFKNYINAYPNAAENYLKIDIVIENDSYFELDVFNINGKIIKNIANGILIKGRYNYFWDLIDDNQNSIPSGVYYIRLKINSEVLFKNITIVH
jgi:hypothetical protein